MNKALVKTDFNFPKQTSVYHGKVRDVYNIDNEKLVMVATDRISAFDVILPEGIPYKGQMLNQIAAKFLETGYSGPDGNGWCHVSGLPRRDDRPRLPVR